MRLLYLAFGLILWTTSHASALDVEEHQYFPGSGARVLKILSTTDLALFAPYVRAFQDIRPDIAVDYTVVSSSELHRAIRDGAQFDLAISSAMDLQLKLANDGFALPYWSDAVEKLPDWARWRTLIFAITAESAVVVVNTDLFEGLDLPETRQDLLALLRDNPDRFAGAVGTYDVRVSGLGYLFATQDDRATDAFWRLNEVMGRLDPQLYCCSGQMIDDVDEGRLALAYNVLDSYAVGRLAADKGGRMQILEMQDFTNVMLRTVLIPATAQDIDAAGAMIDMLTTLGIRDQPGDWPLPSLSLSGPLEKSGFGPIRLGPALMVYLDPLNRRNFLTEWEDAMEQR
ncbi:extracellular solute-binding protein [Loktanella sp. SALINAS62]|uniref:ABC transporter substrate-binding protein n=1 Tax=Loktanella sp. SALINAS62 TaxID=2706124 RepID=UPI001B8C4979|nr:extracellular solute-binding protein [Loktanella sp. SALINAS62]MBS1302601.1 ABC transporter substrate-binding protein [Loktanella sp. SALINAS62]